MGWQQEVEVGVGGSLEVCGNGEKGEKDKVEKRS
jgi:hypothetical protein